MSEFGSNEAQSQVPGASTAANSVPGGMRRVLRELRGNSARNSIATKLLLVLVAATLITFGVLGFAIITLTRHNAEQATSLSAARISRVVIRSASNNMMANDRAALDDMVTAIAGERGVEKLRIVSYDGRVGFSTERHEIGNFVSKNTDVCTACHANGQELTARSKEHFQIYSTRGHRVLAVMTPINNEPRCSNAACHAHPPSQKILGVLDTHMSLENADVTLASVTRKMLVCTCIAAFTIGVISWIFIWRFVHRPLRMLQAGTEHLAEDNLGYQLRVQSSDEAGQLAHSFNTMSSQLFAAREENIAWTRTLEERVAEKTRELKRAHDQMMNAQKMLTIGEMAAVVAHEINNPLAGILTYAKLVKKWITRGFTTPDSQKEACDCLDLVASESKRCGDLVKNLLIFSHQSPIRMDEADLDQIIERTVRLVTHKTNLQSIHVQVSIESNLPHIVCDASQIEQVLLALVMNAIDAMPHGGNLWINCRALKSKEVELLVRDDGMGIPPELQPKIFEPFTTTKDVGKGVGLGCAVSKGIVERHGGTITFKSELGVGTTFSVVLPVDARVSESAKAAFAGADNSGLGAKI